MMVSAMLFGMTRGEIGLVLFIFALVYSAGLLPWVVDRLTSILGSSAAGRPPRSGGT
jgi:hypothetical protein